MDLPHRFPFRWIDRAGPGLARLELTTNSTWLRDGTALPAPFCAEVVAQAAALLLEDPSDREPRRERWLAGIESLTLSRPLLGGESLEVRVRAGARYGGIVKVAGEIFAGTERVCDVTLLLA